MCSRLAVVLILVATLVAILLSTSCVKTGTTSAKTLTEDPAEPFIQRDRCAVVQSRPAQRNVEPRCQADKQATNRRQPRFELQPGSTQNQRQRDRRNQYHTGKMMRNRQAKNEEERIYDFRLLFADG